MSFSIKAMCKHGELVHRRKTSEAALNLPSRSDWGAAYDGEPMNWPVTVSVESGVRAMLVPG